MCKENPENPLRLSEIRGNIFFRFSRRFEKMLSPGFPTKGHHSINHWRLQYCTHIFV